MPVLSACGSIKGNVSVKEPPEGTRAKIRVAMPSQSNLTHAYRGIRAYPNAACISKENPNGGMIMSNAAVGFEKTLNGKKIGMVKTQLSESKNFIKAEFYAAANQPIAFSFYKTSNASSVTQNNITT